MAEAIAKPLVCMPLVKVTDGPLFSSGPGTLSSLQNMDLVDGYGEARGGLEKIKPLGGTAADAISQGGYAAVHQVSTSYGWVRTFDASGGAGAQYSVNKQFAPGNWKPFPSGLVNDAVLFGADLPFSRISVAVSIAANWTVTQVYEYWNGSIWTALTTAETINFAYVGSYGSLQHASWKIPTDWVAKTEGDPPAGAGTVLKYWMRIRLSVVTAFVTLPTIIWISGNWIGMRETYAANHDPRTSANGATLRRLGQSGTTSEWISVSSGLFSGSSSPARLASYRGRVFLVNGKEQKKWDGNAFQDIGNAPPGTGATAAVRVGTGYGAGTRRIYIAFGYGPETAVPPYAHQMDWLPLYGYSTAIYVGEVTTTAPNGFIRVDWSGLTIPANVSVLAIYVTQDLTNVDAGMRPNFPAFLHDTQNRYEFTNATVYDVGSITTGDLSPPVEAFQYDNTPPGRCKYIAVYQNRLWLGDNDVWYWSDAFKPDIFNRTFNFIQLSRASGGRNMGGLEFGDQMVLFTEDQTWGVTNVDLDVPQLFPLALGVGCVAPDSAASGDGRLCWAARDGFYQWLGGRDSPKKISTLMDGTFWKMGFETHGGSKATICDRIYHVRISSPDYSAIAGAWRFSFDSEQWSQTVLAGFTSTLFPLATIHAQLGNNDAGYPHPVWGKVDYGIGAGDYSLFLGDLTTQDNGVNFNCVGTMHFGLPPGGVLSPKRFLVYYQAADGWQTPVLSIATANFIGSTLGSINTGTPDTGSDYNIIGGTLNQTGRGASDIQITFTVATQAGGTLHLQRLFGGILEGTVAQIRRGGV